MGISRACGFDIFALNDIIDNEKSSVLYQESLTECSPNDPFNDWTTGIEGIITLYSGITISANLQNISSASEFPFWSLGNITKKYTIIGPTSGIYQATIVFQGANHLDNSWDTTNSISATITSVANHISEFYTNKLTKWSAELFIDSGTVPAPGISASVEV